VLADADVLHLHASPGQMGDPGRALLSGSVHTRHPSARTRRRQARTATSETRERRRRRRGSIEDVELDFERCYRAVDSRDARFDGWFVTAVTSTGIYCRPSCPAATPRRRIVRFLPSAAAAQRAVFRAWHGCSTVYAW